VDEPDEGYAGPAVLSAAGLDLPVRVRLSGAVDPIDGAYRWGGRIAPDERVRTILRDGLRDASLRIGSCAAQVRLIEADPWGGVLLTTTARPPWPFVEPESTGVEEVEIVIVGAGFGGIGAAAVLDRNGHHDFLVLEAADDVGGTWRDNTYPGCSCDVPSHLYSFSFARYPLWTETFSGQESILRYLRACVRRFGLTQRVRLRTRVESAHWEDGRWRVETTRGVFRAATLIVATGPLSEPAVPDLPGLDSFAGTSFHSARWRHDHDLTGRRVAVIGTGASAAQFVPRIQPDVAALTVFQRTPPWVLPRRSRPISRAERRLYRYLPGAQRLVRTGLYWARESFALGFLHPGVIRRAQRLAEHHLRREVPDPVLRARLTPKYLMGCKRVVLSDDYLASLTRDNVAVVDTPIREVRPDGVVTADGTHHPVDTIILGTGFRVTDPSVAHRVRGRHGRTLAEAWTPSMRAYHGTTVAGFPNLFVLLGPNTGLGHTSVVIMIESQLRHVVDVLGHRRRTGATAMEPTEAAQRRTNERLDRRLAGTVWAKGGCTSWYLDAAGRNSTLWPGYATAFRRTLARFRPGDYTTVPVTRPLTTTAGGGS
jgi:cation diffusion facilitator CzcD-associated flavoprotein CzcO